MKTFKDRCMTCGLEFDNWYDSDDGFQECPQRHEIVLYMSDERYLVALERVRAQIADSSELSSYDDETIGNKDTSCTWGLCSSHKEQWPDAEDHHWPWQFTNQGRVAPLYRDNGQHCPFDTDQDIDSRASGCFYRCEIFQHGLRSRTQALRLYDRTIQKRR